MALVQTYKVIRRQYYGDPGGVAAAGLSKADAEKYAADMAVAERCAYEVVVGDKINK